MPRELLLPIPHRIADKVHHAILRAAENAFEDAVEERAGAANAHRDLIQLADKLNELGRSEVIGW